MKIHVVIEGGPKDGEKKQIAIYDIETPSLVSAVKMLIGGIKEVTHDATPS